MGRKPRGHPWSRRVKTGSICRTKRPKPQPRRLRRETAPFARDDEFLVAMLEESIAFCGGRETDVRRTLEQTAKRLGFTYEALMKGAADGTAVGRVVAQVKREHPAFAARN